MNIFVNVDGLSINASHYGKMDEKKAITAMIEDNNPIPGADKKEKELWCKNAYSVIKEKMESSE